MDAGPDVRGEPLIGQGLVKEVVFRAQLDERSREVVHLPDVDVGQFRRHLQALFGSAALLQRLNHVGDVVTGDQDSQHGIVVVAPGTHLHLQPGRASVRQIDPGAFDVDRLAGQAPLQGAAEGLGPVGQDFVQAAAQSHVPVNADLRRPGGADFDDRQIVVGHDEGERRHADKGRCPLTLCSQAAPRRRRARPRPHDPSQGLLPWKA